MTTANRPPGDAGPPGVRLTPLLSTFNSLCQAVVTHFSAACEWRNTRNSREEHEQFTTTGGEQGDWPRAVAQAWARVMENDRHRAVMSDTLPRLKIAAAELDAALARLPADGRRKQRDELRRRLGYLVADCTEEAADAGLDAPPGTTRCFERQRADWEKLCRDIAAEIGRAPVAPDSPTESGEQQPTELPSDHPDLPAHCGLPNATEVTAAGRQVGDSVIPGTADEEKPNTPEPPRPCWDAATRTLSFGAWSRRYHRRAPSQEQVLAAFQQAGWPERITTGLPGNLSGIVRNFGTTLGANCPLQFEMDGTGKGVRWSQHASSRDVS